MQRKEPLCNFKGRGKFITVFVTAAKKIVHYFLISLFFLFLFFLPLFFCTLVFFFISSFFLFLSYLVLVCVNFSVAFKAFNNVLLKKNQRLAGIIGTECWIRSFCPNSTH